MKQVKFHVAEIRKEKNLKTDQLAKLAGVGPRTIDRVQAEKPNNPSILILLKIADALDTPVEKLFTYE